MRIIVIEEKVAEKLRNQREEVNRLQAVHQECCDSFANLLDKNERGRNQAYVEQFGQRIYKFTDDFSHIIID